MGKRLIFEKPDRVLERIQEGFIHLGNEYSSMSLDGFIYSAGVVIANDRSGLPEALSPLTQLMIQLDGASYLLQDVNYDAIELRLNIDGFDYIAPVQLTRSLDLEVSAIDGAKTFNLENVDEPGLFGRSGLISAGLDVIKDGSTAESEGGSDALDENVTPSDFDGADDDLLNGDPGGINHEQSPLDNFVPSDMAQDGFQLAPTPSSPLPLEGEEGINLSANLLTSVIRGQESVLTGFVSDIQAAVTLVINGVSMEAVNNGDGSFTMDMSLLSEGVLLLDEGINSVVIWLNDGSGDQIAGHSNLFLDSAAPLGTVNNLLSSDSGSSNIYGTVDDPSASVVVTVEGNEFTALNLGDGTWALGSEVMNLLHTGQNHIAVSFEDTLGNSSSVEGLVFANVAPDAHDDVAETTSGLAVVIDILANDEDVDGNRLIVTSLSADHGEVSLNADGTINYVSEPDYVGVDVIIYGINDGFFGSDFAQVDVLVAQAVRTLSPSLEVDSITDVHSSIFSIHGVSTDIFGDITVRIEEHSSIVTLEENGDWQIIWATPLGDGEYIVTAETGNETDGTFISSSQTFVMDAVTPEVTIDPVSQNNGSIVIQGSSRHIEGELNVLVGDQTISVLPGSDGNWILEWPAPAVGDDLEITVSGSDSGGETAQTSVNYLSVDSQAPTVDANQNFHYQENQTAGTAIATVKASDNVEVTSYQFSNGEQTSDNGYFQINATGEVSLTPAGLALGVESNQFESGSNRFSEQVQALDAAGNISDNVAVTFNVDNINDASQFFDQTFFYVENQITGAVVATVDADDEDGVSGFVFQSTATNTSDDGYYQIDNNGVITITALGVASGVNDFESGSNAADYIVSMADGFGTISNASIRLSESGVNEAPVLVGRWYEELTEGDVGDTVTATGALSISDVDAEDNPTFGDVDSTVGDNAYGSFVLSGGSWTYTIDQTAVQSLDAGDSVDDTITYTATDGTAQKITVTINGTDDISVVAGTHTDSANEGNIGDTVTA
ncbi:MAG: hypothetical protein COA42_09040, partial [Alteromonadaceae bacterium]